MGDDLVLEPWRKPVLGGGDNGSNATITLRDLPRVATIEQQVVTEPVVLNAVANSLAAASELRSVARDIREGKLTTTPKLNGLQDYFAKFTERVEASVQKLMDKMDGTAGTTEAAVEKFGGAVDKVAATAKAIDDAANQMTNGGPPLGNS